MLNQCFHNYPVLRDLIESLNNMWIIVLLIIKINIVASVWSDETLALTILCTKLFLQNPCRCRKKTPIILLFTFYCQK